MGYSTKFTGTATITPPLNAHEIDYLSAFAGSRRTQHPDGPYATTDAPYSPTTDQPPAGQPGRWCDWIPTWDGTGIQWNGSEKFYAADQWMAYLIDHFLKPGATAQGADGFEHFTFDHTVNGSITAQGDDPADTWDLVVVDNRVDKHRCDDCPHAPAAS